MPLVVEITPVPVSTIVTKVGNLLLDDSHVRWGVDEIIRWTNEAMGAILAYRPEAFSTTDVYTLVAGTYQSLPNGAVALLDVIRNVGSDGVTPGRVVRETDRKLLDDADPNWHSATPAATIRHYSYDPRTPKSFYCYPPAVAGTKVEVKYVVLPADVSAMGDAIRIGAEYVGPLVNYICYRCNMKDSEFANAQTAQLYFGAFQASLGLTPGAGHMVGEGAPHGKQQ